jgi:hypothetical protein
MLNFITAGEVILNTGTGYRTVITAKYKRGLLAMYFFIQPNDHSVQNSASLQSIPIEIFYSFLQSFQHFAFKQATTASEDKIFCSR